MKTARDILQTYLDELENKKASGGEITGVSSGFLDLDFNSFHNLLEG